MDDEPFEMGPLQHPPHEHDARIGKLRDRHGEVLFIDARKMGALVVE
ncbi:hypothetical protein [Primorskyibacter flagellatus]|uniref:Uncharacterized protein n=1 Tax=Primorskyibacter flagellatus TaxID=1387277 RepID=A0A1W2D7J1_9RHOB|nr:hypothetical protein [Primorskyibacter flagellatus]SMC93371.1 hypothetical protein SAMN06295998_11193 [Primorskyibacter flagellatus]